MIKEEERENKEEIRACIDAERKLRQISKLYPLSVAKLWVPYCHRFDGLREKSERNRGCGRPMEKISEDVYRCNDCDITEKRTCQRDVLLQLGEESTLLLGGNRSGKTELACILAIITAASSSEWWVKEFLRINDLPLDIVPRKPGRVWISSLTFADGLEYIRPKIDKYLPYGSKRNRWKAQDRAIVTLPNGGSIVQMSASAGREAYQGASVNLVILDEEHPSDIYFESLLRVVDSKGKLFLSMSPLKGLTWVFDAYIDIDPQEGHVVHRITGLDNPYISSSKLRRVVAHMSITSQNSRLYGEFGAEEGLVYPGFNNRIHICAPFDPPKEWTRFRSIDFGTSHPFCCLWFAFEDTDGRDCLHVYRELYKTNRTTIENGRRILQMSKEDPVVEWTVADPESRDGRLTLARELGIGTIPAPKHRGVLESINWVKERLQIDANGYPRLKVHKNCANLIKEFRLYSWKKDARSDAPKKVNDHALDALRYQIMVLKRFLLRR